MARVEVVMPQMGESIAEGTVLKWHKKIGDSVKKDETLLEISTDKVDSEIPSPASGVLAEIVVSEQTTVPVQTVIAYLETSAEAGGGPGPAKAPPSGAGHAAGTAAPAGAAGHAGTAAPAAPPARTAAGTPAAPPPERSRGGRFYSPLVMNIAHAENVSMEELERITGSGEGGRVTKKDVLAYLEQRKAGTAPRPQAPVAPAPSAPPHAAPAAPSLHTVGRPVDVPELRAKYPAPGHEILQMNNVLQRMGEHMVRTVQTSPHVFAIHEVDMTNVVRHRKAHAAGFERREGFKLTFTPYVCHAVVEALKKYPLVNSSVEGDKIIRKTFVNLGIAVASENGLIVPVIKNAEEKNFLGLARAVNDLANRTRSKKLSPDDIQGGTFTISNYGVFGTMMGTPLISQPQVAILGTGEIAKRPVVRDDAIAIRSIAYFTLSFDHRLVDGALGGMFLEEIVGRLETVDEETGM